MVSTRSMNWTIYSFRLSSNKFHYIYFTAGRPSFRYDICSQQPESWPYSLAKWKFSSHFKLPVGDSKFVLSCHFSRRIIKTFYLLLSCLDSKNPRRIKMIFICVELKFIVSPSFIVAVGQNPFRWIKFIEFVTPNKFPLSLSKSN